MWGDGYVSLVVGIISQASNTQTTTMRTVKLTQWYVSYILIKLEKQLPNFPSPSMVSATVTLAQAWLWWVSAVNGFESHTWLQLSLFLLFVDSTPNQTNINTKNGSGHFNILLCIILLFGVISAHSLHIRHIRQTPPHGSLSAPCLLWGFHTWVTCVHCCL